MSKLLTLIVTLAVAVVLLAAGVQVGYLHGVREMQTQATQNCGAKFDELTGEFAWIECPPPVPPTAPEVVAPEPDPEEPAAPVEAVPSTPEKPNEPVY